MSKQRKRKNRQPQRVSIPIHGVTVVLPPEFALSEVSAEKAIGNIADEIKGKRSIRSERRLKQETRDIGPGDQWLKTAANIATNTWRAIARMVDPDTGEARDEMKRVYRHIEAISGALKEMGVEIIDPTGRPYDLGMALKVISFEQTPGLAAEEIKETIKPSVVWQGRLIQMGEVIVGTPQTA